MADMGGSDSDYYGGGGYYTRDQNDEPAATTSIELSPASTTESSAASFPPPDPNIKRSPSMMGFSDIPPSKEFSQQFQYCMVFPLEGPQKSEQSGETKATIHTLIASGVEIFPYLSFQRDELIVLIKIDLGRIKAFADLTDFEVQLNPLVLKQMVEAGNLAKQIAGVTITDDPQYSPLSPYEYIYGKFDTDLPDSLYIQENGKSVFDTGVVLKLFYYYLKAPVHQGGCSLEIGKMLHSKKLLNFYPLHNIKQSKDILDDISYLKLPWAIDMEQIKEYFGEKMGFYFEFLAHYSKFLLIPALIGFAFQIIVWYYEDFSHPVLPFYGVFISAWSIVMLEFWKRKESVVAMRWGVMDFEALEPDRPEFKGDIINSYINGKKMIYFNFAEKRARLASSGSAVASFLLLVLGVVISIYILRFELQPTIGSYASTVASAINSAFITMFNMTYQIAAVNLTDIENHRTDTDYEDSMIIKVFTFQFINSYASFFYIAFIASYLTPADGTDSSYLGQCGFSNCMQPLSINLAIIFGMRLFFQNALDILIPYATYRATLKKETDNSIGEGLDPSDKLSPAECDFMKMPYNTIVDSIAMFSDTAIQFGFMTLFVTALPISGFFTLLNNFVKVKLQIWKLLKLHQRAIPVGGQDIGSWQEIFQALSFICVITNGAIIVFTMDLLWDYSTVGRFWIFIGFQWALFGLQYFFSTSIDDMPQKVIIQRARNEFIVDKVIKQVPDEDFGATIDEIEEGEEAELLAAATNRSSRHREDGTSIKTGDGCLPCKRKKLKNFGRRIDGSALPKIPVSTYPQGEQPANYPELVNRSNIKEVLASYALAESNFNAI